MELKFHLTSVLRGYNNLSAQLICYPHSINFFIGASSLHNLVKTQNRQPCYRLKIASYVTALSGLSLNPNFKRKVRNFFLNSGNLKQLSNIGIWHEVLNNSVTPHPSNGNSPLSTFQLIEILRQHRERIAAPKSCRRIGTICIEFELRQTGILVLNVKRHLLSEKRETRRLAFSEEMRQLHSPVSLEWAFV